MPLPKAQHEKVEELVRYIASRPRLSKGARESLQRKQTEERVVTGRKGQTVGEAKGYRGVGFSTRDQDEAKRQLREIDNDLSAQVRIVNEGVDDYYTTGGYPAPYYPWRIAVILRKEKEYQLGAEFLDAFNERFSDGLGQRYQQLVDRAEKARNLAARQKGQS